MKQKKTTIILSLLLILGILTPGVISLAEVKNAASYSKDYSIENFLSDFQYVTHSNLIVSGHTVGAIACGGDASISNFGDGSISASYFHNVLAMGNYAAGNYFSDQSKLAGYAGYVGLPAYYKSAVIGVQTNSLIQYTGSTEYIDFNKAFSDITVESTNLATESAGAYTVTARDITGNQYSGYTLNLPFAKSKNIVIPKSIYDQINYIKLSGISDANDISKNQYTISVVGVSNVEPVSLTFGYIGYTESNSSNTKGVLYSDGQTFNNNNSLKNILGGGIEAGQMNMNGMKLIWNFPDATEVKSDYTSGHIIAPLAAVNLKNGTGNFEGGIIANTINAQSAEAHFYPYNSVMKKNIVSGDASSNSTSDSSTSSNTGSSGITSNNSSNTTSSSSVFPGTTSSNTLNSSTSNSTSPSSVSDSTTSSGGISYNTTSGNVSSSSNVPNETVSKIVSSNFSSSNTGVEGDATSKDKNVSNPLTGDSKNEIFLIAIVIQSAVVVVISLTKSRSQHKS